MMSASEVQAIDDWMFANRIRTRAEAVRRLCETGIAVDRHVLFESRLALADAFSGLVRALVDPEQVEPNRLKFEGAGAATERHILDSLKELAAACLAVDSQLEVLLIARGIGDIASAKQMGARPAEFMSFVRRIEEIEERERGERQQARKNSRRALQLDEDSNEAIEARTTDDTTRE
ncbi:hypothetical protein [Kaistia soli]|nr:hypothetical protein [Kaistia soli]